MKYSEIIYSKAETELKERRIHAEELAQMRRRDFSAKYPELNEIENIMKETALSVIKSVGSGGEKVDISEIAKANLEAQVKKKELLKSAGYPEDYLDDIFDCPKCKDTGYVMDVRCS